MMNRFWEAFNKPVMMRTGQDEAVLAVAGLVTVIVLLAVAIAGYFIYLTWKDKKEGIKRP